MKVNEFSNCISKGTDRLVKDWGQGSSSPSRFSVV